MEIDRNKARAVLNALGQKDRRRRTRPVLPKGQFSLAAVVTLITLSCFAAAFVHYQGERLSTRINADARRFHKTSADEIVPLAAGVISFALAVLTACLVGRLDSDGGLYAAWLIACAAVLGLVASCSLNVEPLSETKLEFLRPEQIAATALFCLSCLLPVGAGLGWCWRFSTTR